MVNIGLNLGALLGFVDVIFALVVFIMTLILIVQDSSRIRRNKIAIYITQIALIPVCLLLAGTILIFNGWRLDPILQFAVLYLNLIIIFLVLKDFLIDFGR